MAIVRTTPKETSSGGAAPAETTPRSVPARPAAPAVARPVGLRARSLRPQTGQAVNPQTFLSDTVSELKKVVWPTREAVSGGTIVTIGLLIFFSAYIFALDALASWIFTILGLYPPTPK